MIAFEVELRDNFWNGGWASRNPPPDVIENEPLAKRFDDVMITRLCGHACRIIGGMSNIGRGQERGRLLEQMLFELLAEGVWRAMPPTC